MTSSSHPALAALGSGRCLVIGEVALSHDGSLGLAHAFVDAIADAGAAVGLSCVHREGIMLKPLPNDLMSSLPEPLLEGFLAVAHELPDHCAMNYLAFR